jgi:hypothetical protein
MIFIGKRDLILTLVVVILISVLYVTNMSTITSSKTENVNFQTPIQPPAAPTGFVVVGGAATTSVTVVP